MLNSILQLLAYEQECMQTLDIHRDKTQAWSW